jgi:hypothetical protein
MKLHPVGTKLFMRKGGRKDGETERERERETDRQTGRQAGRQTDMTKLMVAFHNFANALKIFKDRDVTLFHILHFLGTVFPTCIKTFPSQQPSSLGNQLTPQTITCVSQELK